MENDGLGPLTEPDADGAVFDRHGDEVVQCEVASCKKLMRMRDPKCSHCGHAYAEEAPAPPPPPPLPMRTRGQAGGRPAIPAPPVHSRGGEADDSDEIPF